MKKSIILFSILFFSSCKTKQQFETIWINHSKVPCMTMFLTECMQLCDGDNEPNNKWRNFSDKIEGFNFEEGYLYKLKVKKEIIENPPADASNFKYILVIQLEKNKVNN